VRLAVLAALAAATFAAFAGALRNGWVLMDDANYVFENVIVARGPSLRGVLWFLHESHGGNWVPLTALSHMLDVRLFGLAPAGHHATGILLHVLNALLLVAVLHRMTGAWWRSVVTAAFFALHPLRVESVAWIAERKDVLSTCFFLLTLLAYARWVERPEPRRFAAVAAAFAAGLMSKPMLITVPFLLVVLDAWPLGRLAPRNAAPAPGARRRPAAGPPPPARAGGRSLAGLLGEKWVLFAMAAAAAAVTFHFQRESGALAGMEALSLERRVANALISYWRYIAMTAWPHGLAVFHSYPRDPDVPGAVAAALALGAATAAALALARRLPWFAAGWLWYLGMLVPVIGVVQTGGHAYADRFTYVPGIGLAIAVVWTCAAGLARVRAGRVAGGVAAVVLLAACGAATARQVTVWRDTRTLFTRVLEVAGDNPAQVRVAHRLLGWAILREGRTAEAVPHLEFALGLGSGYEDSLRRVLDRDPSDIETRRTLAATLAREMRAEDAIREYRGVLARDSTDVDALNNVAWIRATHERAAVRDGREAVRLAERARDACPEPVAPVYSTLAAAYAEAGRYPEAIRAGTRAVGLARAAGRLDDARRYARQLARYREGWPYHFEN
jgi:tetratricopeptide (TPR) repeat protein